MIYSPDNNAMDSKICVYLVSHIAHAFFVLISIYSKTLRQTSLFKFLILVRKYVVFLNFYTSKKVQFFFCTNIFWIFKIF